jgi:hypothetical protein
LASDEEATAARPDIGLRRAREEEATVALYTVGCCLAQPPSFSSASWPPQQQLEPADGAGTADPVTLRCAAGRELQPAAKDEGTSAVDCLLVAPFSSCTAATAGDRPPMTAMA